MGMFDYIQCLMPLPATERMPESGTLFQTKDTADQYMTIYTVEADGRLTWRPYHIETVPLEERPDPAMPLRGCIRRVEKDSEVIPYHGDIYFYHLSREDEWWEYKARFTDGVCSRIELIEYKPPPQQEDTP